VSRVDVRDQTGESAGSVELDEAVFGIQPNVPVMHQVVTAQLAARRGGTQSTKTRAEVAGGGSKPWRQKGTGRSRQGSTSSPQWRGGGVALGPKPRSYRQRTPKKMVALALRSALSDRASDGKVVVVDGWSFDQPSTKAAVAALRTLEVDGRVLVVLATDDRNAWLSFRNLPEVHCLLASELNAYDVLVSDWVVFTRETLPGERARETETTVDIGSDAAQAPAGAASETSAVAEGRAGEVEPSGADDTAGEAEPSGADDTAGEAEPSGADDTAGEAEPSGADDTAGEPEGRVAQ
jgi:large subunit ribosomal protein L4